MLMNKGMVLRYLGRHDEAITYCRQACRTTDHGYVPHMQLTAALAEAGQMDEAQVALEQTMRLQPDLSIYFLRRRRGGMHEGVREKLFDSLRKAGLPEE